MIICESLLLTALIAMLLIGSVSDCKKSIIPNKLLTVVAVFAILVDLVYYIVFVADSFVPFITNLCFLTVISTFFYGYNLWAAGDSKMLVVIGLCLPGRFYDFWGVGLCSSFAIIIFVFSIAFIYVTAESVVIGIKNKNLFQVSLRTININWKQWIISYFAMVSTIILLNYVLSMFLGRLLADNAFFSMAASFLIVLTVIQVRERIANTIMYIWATVSWIVLTILNITGMYSLRFSSDIKSWGLLLLIMLLRMIDEKYNYQIIPTNSVRAGQILSAATIFSFAPSRVQGLPTGATEDLRSRITASEAESIRRWENSAYGKPYIIIVRKIPFAIFISIGTVIFLGIEVSMLWYYR